MTKEISKAPGGERERRLVRGATIEPNPVPDYSKLAVSRQILKQLSSIPRSHYSFFPNPWQPPQVNTPAEQQLDVLAYSFDFDNCLSHEGYILDPAQRGSLAEHNPLLLSRIRQEITHKKRQSPHIAIVVFNGSNRQSKALDDGNQEIQIEHSRREDRIPFQLDRNRLSSFKTLNDAFASELERFVDSPVRFDPFLLADTYYNGVYVGEAYRRATHPDAARIPQLQCVHFDASKISLLYAQTQKIAADYLASNHIVFSYYDDKLDVVKNAHDFFRNNPEFLPSNVTLMLFHYDLYGPRVSGRRQAFFSLPPIKGGGITNTNYRNTTREMREIVLKQEDSITIVPFDRWPKHYELKTPVVAASDTEPARWLYRR